jgi:hypothetical protein
MSAITTEPADTQERLSLAYLTAVAARAGCQVLETKVDRNGIDATIKPIAGVTISIDIQMKSVSRDIRIEDGAILSFQLDRPTYDKLRRADVQSPQLLVVFEMPVDETLWLSVKSEERTTTLRHLAYWLDLRGKSEIDSASTSIHIPITNVFDHHLIASIIAEAHRQALEGRSWSGL